MIAASRVIDLFGETGPSGPPAVGGASEDAIVYYPGGYGSLREVSRMIQEAGPSGLAQAGGSRLRKTQSSRQRQRQRSSRKNNKKSRRSSNRR